MSLSPLFGGGVESIPAQVPYLVLYQLVLVNYGEFASADDAETFGANALGLPKDDYYQALCEMANQLSLTGVCPQPANLVNACSATTIK